MTSLRARVLLSNLTVVAVVLAVVGLAVLGGLERFLVRGLEDNLVNQSRVASVVASQTLLTPPQAADPADLLPAQGARLALAISQTTGLRTQVFDRGGRLVGDSEAAAPVGSSRRELAEAAQGHRAYSEVSLPSMRLLQFAAPLEVGGKAAGTVAFILPLSSVDAILRQAQTIFWATAGGSLLLTLLFGLGLSRAVTAPLTRLRNAAREVAQGRYDHSIEARGRDELADLAASFNHMAAEVGKAVRGLESERAKLEAVLTNMGDGVLAVDASGTVRLANPAARGLLGQEDEAVEADELGEVSLPDSVAEFARQAALRPDGLVRELAWQDRVLWLQGSAVHSADLEGAVVVVRDITELRRLEQQSRQFVSNVSHELRTPLTAIRGFAEILEQDPGPDVRSRALGHLRLEAERLYRLVSDVLQLSSLESLPVRPQTLDLVPLLQQAADQMAPRAGRYGQNLQVSLPARLEVRGDADRLKQVVLNLLDNALKYTPPGTRIRLQAVAEGRVARVSVSDTGPGIPEEHQERLFERFYRVDKARSRSLGGSGLGLAIVKEVVEKHGGTVTLHSAPGRGTDVSFTLSLAGEASAAAEAGAVDAVDTDSFPG
ncbi:MAG: ATP-binding protein [Bacillota bacterium]